MRREPQDLPIRLSPWAACGSLPPLNDRIVAMRPDWAIAFAEDGRIGRARERPSGVAHARRIVHSLLRRRLPPEVGVATLELLERFGLDVEYPCDQTCCGQPMTNAGCQAESAATEALFVRNFAPYDYVVTPSGSCAPSSSLQFGRYRARRRRDGFGQRHSSSSSSCMTSSRRMRSRGRRFLTRSHCTTIARRFAVFVSPACPSCAKSLFRSR
jgi:hypothetical protein